MKKNSQNSQCPEFSLLMDILRWRAIHQPEKLAYTFLKEGETEEEKITYKELDVKARSIGALLQTTLKKGACALLLYPQGLEFVTAFLGCLYAGVVAIPANLPRNDRSLSRLQAITADTKAKGALTSEVVKLDMECRFQQSSELRALQLLPTDNLSARLEKQWQEPALNSGSLAFLQYTSGSTGNPKGVMVTHGNLLYNLRMIKDGLGNTDQSILVSWLPLFHDMGLISKMLQVLYLGATCILMSPAAFIQKPFRWLQAISQYKATMSGGPNFAYDLCVQKITPEQREQLDLSRWQVAVNGAEPIRADTLERFYAAFAPCGFRKEAFYPAYGMAEATLMISGKAKSAMPDIRKFDGTALEQDRVVPADAEQGHSRKLVGCGRTLLEQKVMIVDPGTCIQCSPGRVGEIWVQGPSVAQGYWKNPGQTEYTFHAYLADTKQGPYLRTGDLGFIQEDELFITGRIKDLIIIRGRNHYPQDIESTVKQSHPALIAGNAVVFSIDTQGEERLVIVCEVQRQFIRKLNFDQVAGAIQQAVSQEHDLQVYGVELLKPTGIPKTSSGKLQRHACKVAFLAKSLASIGSWRLYNGSGEPHAGEDKHFSAARQRSASDDLTPQTIENWLVTKMAHLLKVNAQQLDTREPFSRYGLDSAAALNLSGDLSEWLGKALSPTLVYDYPTIKALAKHLAGNKPPKKVISETHIKRQNEPIAIIGMGCRLPGAPDCEAFWQLLHEGVDAISKVPSDRRDREDGDDRALNDSEIAPTRYGGFLPEIDQFDPQFFGISPREAVSMDPQQRLLLEVSWEALENAGLAAPSLSGSQTGVFIGVSSTDYARLQFERSSVLSSYAGTGSASSIAANRLSYILDLRGPSTVLDTACSSSLYAVHQACQSLRQPECDLALAGGVNLMIDPTISLVFSQAGMLSPDGRCKTFSADADGYVRGEGCGIIVLKRLSDAMADGDTVLAMIKGSAVNQDGRSNGLTAPNGPAQQTVIKNALKMAGLPPTRISYVETHGTGTSLGDPIEVNSLKEVLFSEPSSEQLCWIGSVKTNIGHLEAAAGIAGLIKVVLAMQHKQIPAHLHFTRLNPEISLVGTPIKIPVESQPWAKAEFPRVAGISSFGFGGTNAHLIVEEAPEASPAAFTVDRPVHLLTLSAKTEGALKELAQRYQSFLAANPDAVLGDVCYTANTGRSHFAHRLAVTAESCDQLRTSLDAYASGKLPAGLITGHDDQTAPLTTAFLFTGQGSPYVAMGQQLYETQPAFRQILERCNEIVASEFETSLLEGLYPKKKSPLSIDDTIYTQPVLFALEAALFELWKSWGVVPGAVIGHSIGEFAAAYAAGVFSLEDGLKLVVARGRLMEALPPEGGMAAVFADETHVAKAMESYEGDVFISAVNNQNSVVISGKSGAVEAITKDLADIKITSIPLKVSHAFHTPFMGPMLPEFEKIAQQVKYSSPQLPIVSTVTGDFVTEDIATPGYWVNHVQQPVRFAEGVKALDQQGYNVFVEIGPKPILLGMARESLFSDEAVWLPNLREGQSDWSQLLSSLSQLYIRGFPIDWQGLDREVTRRKLALPSYPFQRQRYWFDTEEKGRKKTSSSSRNQTSWTPLLDHLRQGDIEQLTRMLVKTKRVSEESQKYLPEFLQALVGQCEQEQFEQSLGDLLYEVQWPIQPRREQKAGQDTTDGTVGTWLIFADRGGVGESLAAHLEEQGHGAVLVYPGQEYCSSDKGDCTVNPATASDFQHLLQNIKETCALPLWRVVHLWSLDAPDIESLSPSHMAEVQLNSCGSVLHIVQVLAKSNEAFLPSLWLVTRNAVPVGYPDRMLGVSQSPLWGLGKVISLEHPEMWGGLVDLSLKAPSNEVVCLAAELQEPQGEEQIALRETGRHVARLVNMKPTPLRQIELQADATYLITGGLGALGLKTAQWLVEKGGQHLVLLGRRGASAEAQEMISQLEQAGATIHIETADVCDEGQMAGVFKKIAGSGFALRGVIHAAGVSGYQHLADISLDTFLPVLQPKVAGGLVLHQLTRKMTLDFFICYSSISSVWGSAGQAHYGVANHFLDMLVQYRRLQGLPGLSVNWGPWSGGGMATAKAQMILSRLGLSPLSPEQGLGALNYLLGAACVQTSVVNVDWTVFKSLYEARKTRLLLERIKTPPQEDVQALSPAQRTDLIQQLEAAPSGERENLLVGHLQREVARIMGFAPSQLPGLEEGFFEMGMDSLMAKEFIHSIEESLGTPLPLSIVFDCPTIKQLTDHITLEILQFEPLVGPESITTKDENNRTMMMSTIEDLSEEDMDASIEEKLLRLEGLAN